jgi:hypothetical protein
MIEKAIKIDVLPGSEFMEFNLSEKDIPYGGNKFTDSEGGIARRWQEDSTDNKKINYQALYERTIIN